MLPAVFTHISGTKQLLCICLFGHNEKHSEYGFLPYDIWSFRQVAFVLMLDYFTGHVIPCLICLLVGGFPASSGEGGPELSA